MSGAYITWNGGESWKMLNFPGGAQAFAFDPSNPETVYVAAAGLHRSTDGGHTWDLIFPDKKAVERVTYILRATGCGICYLRNNARRERGAGC
jgi:hypothetical protein